MTARQSLAIAASLGLALSLLSTPAVQAQNFLDMLRGFTNPVRHSGGKILPNSGSVQATVDSGISNYHNEIASAASAGRLTTGEEATLRNELIALIAMRDEFMADGGYSGPESDQMVAIFNRLNGMIAVLVNNSDLADGRRWNGGGSYPNFDSVARLQARVLQRLDRAAANGVVSRAESRTLRNEYQNIARRLDRHEMRGNLNTHPLVRRLVALDRSLSNKIATRGSQWF